MPRLRRSSAASCAAVLLGVLLTAGPAAAQIEATSGADSAAANHRYRHAVLLLTGAYVVGGVPVMERVWYRERERVPFHFSNDNAGYLQVDKFGHAFGAHVQSHLGYRLLRRSGMPKRQALLYGGTLGLILQTPIEVMDGLHEGLGFSWGDMAANAAGSALVVGQVLLLGEEVVRYKFSYRPSEYGARANGYLGTTALDRLLEDYNGHTYWLTLPAGTLIRRAGVPPWLSLAIGYGADGMYGVFENITEHEGVAIPEAERRRQFLLSLDVDWSRVNTESPLLRALLTGLMFIKLPFPALELTSDGRVRRHLLYY
jgi:hypothetical protein